MKKTPNISIIIRSLICGVSILSAFGLRAQTLPITSGLQLWLKADAGVSTNASGLVTGWADQSGFGNNAAPTNNNTSFSPTYSPGSLNGLPTLRFPGGTKYLDVQDSPNLSTLGDNVTILVVIKDDNFSGFRAGVSKTQGNFPAPFDWWNNAGSTGAGNTVSWLNNSAGATQEFIGSVKPQAGIYNVMSFSWGGGVFKQYLNDFISGFFTYTATSTNAPVPLRIGSRGDLVTQLLGNVAEVLVYQPALADSDVYNVVTNYLKPKYGLVFDIPPVVLITSPATGSSAPANTSIPVFISASDPDGTVTSVTLYGNGLPIANTAIGPFNLNVSAAVPGTLNLTAVAIDNVGRSTTSAPVSITITGTLVTSPPTNSLQVWLAANSGVTTNSDGTIASWTDELGNGNDATPNDPSTAPTFAANTVNGEPVIHFNGGNQFLQVPDSGTSFTTGDFSTFAVARFTGGFPNAPKQVIWTKTFLGAADPVDWWFQTTGQGEIYRGAGTGAFGGPVLGGAVPSGQFIAVGATAGGSTITHYLGASTNGTGTITNTTADGGLPLLIGRRDDGGTQLNGDIAEILIFNQALSGTDISNTVSYLGTKYNLVQPTFVPTPPVVSITSPSAGSLVAPSTVVLSASATSPLGAVTSVELFANGVQYASLTNSPYQVSLDLLTPGTATFYAVAVDNWGSRSTSAPVVVTLTGPTNTPAVTNNLALWLKPDAGIVTNSASSVVEWDDQSGLGNNAYQTNSADAPSFLTNAVNGLSVLHFTPPGSAKVYMDVSNSPSLNNLTTNFAIFALTRVNDRSGFYNLIAEDNANQAGPFEWRLNNSSGLPSLLLGNGTSTPVASSGLIAPPLSVFSIEAVVVSNGVISHYLQINTNGTSTFTATPADSGKEIRIGNRDDLGTQLKGDIAEIMVYSSAPSSPAILQNLNYLSEKYGITQIRLSDKPPVVGLTLYTNGVTAPGLVSVTAQISDPNSTISHVNFLVNGTLIATETSPPYQIPLGVLTPGTVTVEVVAIDVLGVSASSSITVTIPGSGPAVPPTNGLVLWLKADTGVATNADGTIASWADQSGFSNNALPDGTAASPTLITDPVLGVPVVTFTGAPMCLDVADAPSVELTGDMSLFYSADFTNFGAVQSVCAKTFGNLPYPFDYQVTTGAIPRMARGNTDGSSSVSGATALPGGQYVETGVTVGGATVTHYLNHTVNGSASLQYGVIDDGTPLKIGSRDDFGTQFSGNLGELLLYNQALTGSVLVQANTYLAGRYGIATYELDSQAPILGVALQSPGVLQIFWPPGYVNFVLQSSTNLSGGVWTPVVTNPPNNQFSINATNAARFFRLQSH